MHMSYQLMMNIIVVYYKAVKIKIIFKNNAKETAVLTLDENQVL